LFGKLVLFALSFFLQAVEMHQHAFTQLLKRRHPSANWT